MYVLIGYDGPLAIQGREKYREAHLEKYRNLSKAGKVVLAGPFRDGSGSLIVLNVATKTEAELIAKSDPYVIGGVFARYEVKPFDRVLP